MNQTVTFNMATSGKCHPVANANKKIYLNGENTMNKKNTIAKRVLSSVMALFVAMIFSVSAEAASCKGKTEASCSADNDCSWVNSFTRKDNVKVSGHCRASSGKKGSVKGVSQKANKDAKKSAKKSTDVDSKKSKRDDDKDESDKKSKKDKKYKKDKKAKKVKKEKKAKKDKKEKKSKNNSKKNSKKEKKEKSKS